MAGETSIQSWISAWIRRESGHISGSLGLDLDSPEGRSEWLTAARLFAESDVLARRVAAFGRLRAEFGTHPTALATADAGRVAAALGDAGLRHPERLAGGLCRAAGALVERHDGDLERLAGECDDLETLGRQIAGLAPGLGRGTVLRFLRPLREIWDAAAEIPLAPDARAAAAHLGWLDPDDDPEGDAGALRRGAEALAPEAALRDVEAALEALGSRACRRGRSDRCPLGEECPALRGESEFR